MQVSAFHYGPTLTITSLSRITGFYGSATLYNKNFLRRSILWKILYLLCCFVFYPHLSNTLPDHLNLFLPGLNFAFWFWSRFWSCFACFCFEFDCRLRAIMRSTRFCYWSFGMFRDIVHHSVTMSFFSFDLLEFL